MIGAAMLRTATAVFVLVVVFAAGMGVVVALTGCATPSPQPRAGAGTRPNIVLILADDIGYADPGFHGGDPRLSPHIDRLAAQGMRMSAFYVHSVCAATRAALLTGRYAFRTNMDWRSEDFGKPTYLAKLGMKLAHNERGEPTRMIHALDTRERTIAEGLREAGYFTSIVGKWHLGEWLPEHLPMGQGFDHQYGHYGWGIDYNNYTIPHNAPARFAVYDWHRNQKPVFEQGYSTDLIANEAVRVISEQSAAKPFFVYVALNAIHGPLEEIPRYRDELDKRQAALKCMDDAVGRIVGAVDQGGFAANTIVIFTNDNGGLRDEYNKPWRGTKNTTYEGGVRVPCVMRWPGHFTPGSTSDARMHVVDLMPTFLTLAAGRQRQERPVDGLDMGATLAMGTASPRTEIIFEVRGSVRQPTILSGNYKLMGSKLFDIVADPTESTDIAAAHPGVVRRLAARLEEVGRQRPSLARVLGATPLLMNPPLPFVYGRDENAVAPAWLRRAVEKVRATQPKTWAPGKTPWPQAPTGDTIRYTGDGR
jgi:arylsulfatase A-like enzyme